MLLQEYQQLAKRTVPNKVMLDLLPNFSMGLAGETGEVLDSLKKYLYHGHPLDCDHVAEELGDILFYLSNIADLLGLELKDVAERNIEKLKKRYPNGFDKDRSINRTV